MFRNKFSERLYMRAPDLLYAAKDGTWYAAYHEEKAILTNAGKNISAYTYKSKEEYQKVRNLIVHKYKLQPAKIKYSAG